MWCYYEKNLAQIDQQLNCVCFYRPPLQTRRMVLRTARQLFFPLRGCESAIQMSLPAIQMTMSSDPKWDVPAALRSEDIQ